jgi:membrane protein DedA with SNARE-associated domain
LPLFFKKEGLAYQRAGDLMDLSAAHLLQAAGRSPLLQGAAIIAGTFILEDAATAAAAMSVQSGAVAFPVALVSLYLGIVLGDLGLYGLGRLAATFPWARRLIPAQRQDRGRNWLNRHVFKVVFISRFVPGARLPTYTTCGFLGVNLTQFTLAAIGATLIWTSALFALSLRVGKFLLEQAGTWRWVGALGFIVVIIVMGRIAAKVQEKAQ